MIVKCNKSNLSPDFSSSFVLSSDWHEMYHSVNSRPNINTICDLGNSIFLLIIKTGSGDLFIR